MMKQTDIAKVLKVSTVTVHYILTGKRQVSWPLAQKLAGMFPGKDVIAWKNATPEEFSAAWEQYFAAREVA